MDWKHLFWPYSCYAASDFALHTLGRCSFSDTGRKPGIPLSIICTCYSVRSLESVARLAREFNTSVGSKGWIWHSPLGILRCTRILTAVCWWRWNWKKRNKIMLYRQTCCRALQMFQLISNMKIWTSLNQTVPVLLQLFYKALVSSYSNNKTGFWVFF